MRARGGLGAPYPPPWALAPRGLQPPPRLLPGPRGDTAESLPAAGTILTCNRSNAGFLSRAHHVWAEAEVPWAPEGFMKGLLCALERELPPPPTKQDTTAPSALSGGAHLQPPAVLPSLQKVCGSHVL